MPNSVTALWSTPGTNHSGRPALALNTLDSRMLVEFNPAGGNFIGQPNLGIAFIESYAVRCGCARAHAENDNLLTFASSHQLGSLLVRREVNILSGHWQQARGFDRRNPLQAGAVIKDFRRGAARSFQFAGKGMAIQGADAIFYYFVALL